MIDYNEFKPPKMDDKYDIYKGMDDNGVDINKIFSTSEIYEKQVADERIEEMRLNARSENMKIDPLVASLKEATHLPEEQLNILVMQAQLFLTDLKKNIRLDQFDLADKYSEYSIDEWNSFLVDKIVSQYISKHKRTMMKTKAEVGLADPLGKNKGDNLRLIAQLEEQERQENKENIVIMRIPQKIGRDASEDD